MFGYAADEVWADFRVDDVVVGIEQRALVTVGGAG
ncbi:hypothetical protein QFZ76_010110 [Streptomyces sp. V4I2]|nr:hypothetical protein [Streptomyces sp. V4I2]